MKKIFDRHVIREYWQHAMHSVHKKMARGAELITRLIPWGRGDHWRRKEDKKNSSK
jgi:hypothetical protein